MHSTDFADKVVLVLGGSRGIGAAIVRRFARQGASLFYTWNGAPEKAQALREQLAQEGFHVTPIQADSANVDAIRAAVEVVSSTHGRVDILVNNAGILLRNTVDKFPVEDFDRMLAVNVRAPFFAVQAAANVMPRGGKIVIIGSIVADRAAFPGTSVYAMTKSAVAGMVRGLAVDLAAKEITINTVQPGPIETDMNPKDSPHRDAVLNMLPLGRMGKDDEVAGLVAYLAGEEASFITGSAMTIDGGYLA
ncbi:SDR family oxidoreductase [Rouxiella sp. Mn2063]|uniref:SDR family oxidoreductase n=1 Tax=Rouxiella sp. Mn2063 TaxID=3395262 RepID=UPI003BCAA495